MDRLIYTALTGMDAAMNRQRAIANNLANASTPGFRGEEFAVTPATLKGPSLEARAMAKGAVRGANMALGSINDTGRALDIAVQGEALIALQAADGGEVYTRRGDLRVTPNGLVENGDGLPVMSEGGPLTVPAGSRISFGDDGSVFATDLGAPGAQPELVGRIKLADPDGSPLVKGIDGFLKVPGGGVLPDDPTARITTGALEGSNINTAATLVEMIEAQRAFEQRSKMIATAGELDAAGARLMALGAS
ncbi:flagellar basal body rod protein FlgF [Erythrobacter sp. HA6-11]